MVRCALLAVALVLLAGAPDVRGQDSDEVKRLKKKIELLEAKLEAANLKIEKLEAQLKAGAVNKPGDKAKASRDALQKGAKLVGLYSLSYSEPNGKKVTGGADLEVEITARTGKEFTAEFWWRKRMTGAEYQGTIENGQVIARMTKALTNDIAKHEVANTVFKGQLDGNALAGTVTMAKVNPSFRAKVEAKLKKQDD